MMKHRVLLANEAKLKLANCYYFTVVKDLCKILVQ